jgi:hypothetical protein
MFWGEEAQVEPALLPFKTLLPSRISALQHSLHVFTHAKQYSQSTIIHHKRSNQVRFMRSLTPHARHWGPHSLAGLSWGLRASIEAHIGHPWVPGVVQR